MTRLLSGERPILGIRQHWSVVAPVVGTAVAIIVVSAIVMHLIPETTAGRSITNIKQLVELAIVILSLLVVAVRIMQWRFATYTLTDRRIVVQRGIVSRVTESIALDRVQDTVVRQNLLERMIGTGDVEIESAGRDGVELLHRIPNPEVFYNALMEAIEAHRVGGPVSPGPATSGPVMEPADGV